MKESYLKQFNGDISNLAVLDLDEDFLIKDQEQEEREKHQVIIQELISEDVKENREYVDHLYKFIVELPKEKDEQGRDKIVSIGGFVEVAKKPDKDSKIKKNDERLMASLYSCIPVLREKPKNTKVIGYIKIADSDTYIAIYKKKVAIIPIILLGAGVGIAVVIATTPEIKSPIDLDKFIQGQRGEGTLEIERVELDDAPYTRSLMNVNVTLIDSQMNLRYQNHQSMLSPNEISKEDIDEETYNMLQEVAKQVSDEDKYRVVSNGTLREKSDTSRNEGDFKVYKNGKLYRYEQTDNDVTQRVKIYLLGKVDDTGSVVESYITKDSDFGKQIAETPLIYPGENMETITLSEGITVEQGNYVGMALVENYDIDEENSKALLMGENAFKLNIIAK